MTEELAANVEEVEAEEVTTGEASPVKVMIKALEEAFGDTVNVAAVPFNFRAVKYPAVEAKEATDTTPAIEGKEAYEVKRDTLTLAIPCPNVEGILVILKEGGKPLEMLLDAMQEIPKQAARGLLSSEEGESLTLENFPVEKLDWAYIANLPKATRNGGGIAKEIWKDFCADYVSVMVLAVPDKPKAAHENAAKILEQKFSNHKTAKDVIQFLVDRLSIWADKSTKAEEFAPCVEFLLEKATDLLAADQTELMDNL